MGQDKKLFVYGTLKRGFCNNWFLNKSRFLKEYIIEDYILYINRLPYMVESKGDFVKGELFEVEDNDFYGINWLELGSGYQLKQKNGIYFYTFDKILLTNIMENVIISNEYKKGE